MVKETIEKKTPITPGAIVDRVFFKLDPRGDLLSPPEDPLKWLKENTQRHHGPILETIYEFLDRHRLDIDNAPLFLKRLQTKATKAQRRHHKEQDKRILGL